MSFECATNYRHFNGLSEKFVTSLGLGLGRGYVEYIDFEANIVGAYSTFK